jgi:hypothetical protein
MTRESVAIDTGRGGNDAAARQSGPKPLPGPAQLHGQSPDHSLSSLSLAEIPETWPARCQAARLQGNRP